MLLNFKLCETSLTLPYTSYCTIHSNRVAFCWEIVCMSVCVLCHNDTCTIGRALEKNLFQVLQMEQLPLSLVLKVCHLIL